MTDKRDIDTFRRFCFWGAFASLSFATTFIMLYLHEEFVWWATGLVTLVLGGSALGFGKMWNDLRDVENASSDEDENNGAEIDTDT